MNFSFIILKRDKNLNIDYFLQKINKLSCKHEIIIVSENKETYPNILSFTESFKSNYLSRAIQFCKNKYIIIIDNREIETFNFCVLNNLELQTELQSEITLFNAGSNAVITDISQLPQNFKVPSSSNFIFDKSFLSKYYDSQIPNDLLYIFLLSKSCNIMCSSEIICNKCLSLDGNSTEQLKKYKLFVKSNKSCYNIVNESIKKNKVDFILLYDNESSLSYQKRYLATINKELRNKVSSLSINFNKYNTVFERVNNINEKCSSFVGFIYVIVANDINIDIRLSKIPNVIILYENDILPFKYANNFNSATIEIYLHTIFGLSDKYIYCKDWNLITSELQKDDFFLDNFPRYDEAIFTLSNQYILPFVKSQIADIFETDKLYLENSITKFANESNLSIKYYVMRLLNNYQYRELGFIPEGFELRSKKMLDLDRLSLSDIVGENPAKFIHIYKGIEKMPFSNINFSNNVFYTEKSSTQTPTPTPTQIVEEKPSVPVKVIEKEKKEIKKKFEVCSKKPKISIIVPCYNVAPYVEKCLESIKNQTLTNFECIAIDDGSTDKTLTIMNRFKSDKRFKIIHKSNSGVSDTRNLGIDLAQGEFIGFVDSDDYISPDRYKICVNKAEELKIDIVRCSIEQIRVNGTKSIWEVKEGLYDIKDGRILSTMEYDNSGCPSVIYRTKLLKDNNIRFRGCSFGEDLIFNAECYCISGKLYNISKPLYFYQRHENSLSLGKQKRGAFTKVLNCFDACCNHLKEFENFKYFEKIFRNNFFNRPSMKNLRKDSIDYIVPYVDSNDPLWIELYKKYSPNKVDENVNGMSRFRDDLNLFKYQVRGLDKFLNWLDVVHIIVQSESQIPDWIDRDRVHIVYHKDFIPEEYLPTFNSCTIEMFLHRIEGLSEKFIYGNDDILFAGKINKHSYFDNDKICNILEPHKIYAEDGIPVWKQIIFNTYKAIYGKDYSKTEYVVPPHIEMPYTKTLLKETYSSFKKIMDKSVTRFRDRNNLNQYIYTYFAAKRNLLIAKSHSRIVMNTSGNIETIKSAVLSSYSGSPKRSIVLNDTGITKELKYEIIKALEVVFAEKCFYEK